MAFNYHFKDCGIISYDNGLNLQKYYINLVKKGALKGVFLLLEHTPVYTIGKGCKKDPQYFNYLKQLADLYFIDRGGDITFHGPGQLVVYPILDLNYFKRDLHLFIEMLEEAIIRLLKLYNIVAGRKAKYTGVWIGNEKISSIGIACRNWITWHGIAFNVNVDLNYFSYITPCGISEFGVTSLEKEGLKVSVNDLKTQLIPIIEDLFNISYVNT
ncbi:MAG: lipoyl(octanoyl) transferase LipB [Deferribacterota bacterium]|nr:lipoyl(octanoyl) transferase LipB [Deferribacterota bacterium]